MSSRKSSEIWNHFTEQDNNKAKCDYCSSVISVTNGSTGNLSRHMKTKHFTIAVQNKKNRHQETTSAVPMSSHVTNPDDPAEVSMAEESDVACSQRPDTFKSRYRQTTIFEHNKRPLSISKSKQLDEQLIKMIVKEYHPFRIVEDPEFIKFVNLACPGYKLPNRKTISTSLIPKLYHVTKVNIQEKLNKADAVCITTDGWTSINNESFIGVTAHFLNNNDELSVNLIGCFSFNARHTAQNLKNLLVDIFEEWRISDKVVVIISDNAANIVAAIRLGGWPHLGCFAHSLNLVVQESLKPIDETVQKVKKIVQYFKKSSHALARLHQVQEQMGLPLLKLKQDVCTRWNSTYEMLNRVLQIKNAIISTLAILSSGLNVLSPSDWAIIENAVNILRIFNDVTTEISAEKTVSISKLIILTRLIKGRVVQFLDDVLVLHEPPLHKMADTLNEQLDKRFSDIENNNLINQATLLDPRFKNIVFSEPTKAAKAIRKLKREITLNYVGETSTPVADNPSDVEVNIASTSSLWTDFDNLVQQSMGSENVTPAAIVEVDKYLHEQLLGRTQDPITWWKTHKIIYPLLYKIVRRRLCIVATSVPCERLFSKAGQITTEKRSRLKSSKISEILFLNHNLE